MNIHRIGDPHIGRSFIKGTPIARRGDREDLQLQQFELELMRPNVEVNVMMGDIFDKFIVSPTVVLEVYELYFKAAHTHKDTDFILIKGNHDVSRDVEVKSSFDLLTRMLKHIPNVTIVEDHLNYKDKLLFISYNAFTNSVSYAESIIAHYGLPEYQEVFGHWDTISYGNDEHNLIPYKTLSKVTKKVSTGHIHIPEISEKEGMEINVVGSLQPYSHAEDPPGVLYVSKTIEEYKEDPWTYKNKCLRLLIKPGEEIPEDIECLQFTYKIVREEEDEDLEVTMGDFDFKDLLFECLKETEVPEETINEVWKTYINI